MKKTLITCDQCGKECGGVKIPGTFFHVFNLKASFRALESRDDTEFSYRENKELDFCDVGCLLEYFEKHPYCIEAI